MDILGLLKSVFSLPTHVLILIGMGVVMIAIISLFVPGGPKRIVAIILSIVTLGAGAYFLTRRNKKMVDDYNKLVEEYKEAQAKSEAADEKVNALLEQNRQLEVQAGSQKADMEAHLKKYEEAKLESAKLAVEQAKKETEIELKTQKLETGYKPGTASVLRAQWEAMKAKKEAQATATNAPQTEKIVDPNPVEVSRPAINIEVRGYRLKGDIA